MKRKRKDLIIQNAKKKVETGALDMLENGGNNKQYMSKHHAGGDFAENDFGVPYYNSTEYASIDI